MKYLICGILFLQPNGVTNATHLDNHNVDKAPLFSTTGKVQRKTNYLEDSLTTHIKMKITLFDTEFYCQISKVTCAHNEMSNDTQLSCNFLSFLPGELFRGPLTSQKESLCLKTSGSETGTSLV